MPTGVYNHKPHTEETKRKMSLKKIGNKHSLGIKRSEEFKEHQSLIRKGIKPKHDYGGWNKGLTGEKSHLWRGGFDYERKLYLNARRRVLKYGAVGSHTQEEWQELKKEFDYTCFCCKKSEPEITLSEDHIIPLSKGGSDNIENIQLLCRSCNSKKHTKIIKYQYA